MSAVTDIIGSANSSSGPAPTQYNTWQPNSTNMSGLDNSFGSTVQNNLSQGSAASPGWQQYLSQLTSNPYQSGAQSASGQAGQAYTNAGNSAIGNAGTLNAAGNQLYQTAFDPQNALYHKQYQLNKVQTKDNQAARGITNSGYGAELANESSQNFNTNWQNQQLQRQLSGVQGASSAFSQAGQQGTNGAQSLNLGGQTPLNTYNSGVSTTGQGLNTYASGTNAQNQNSLSQIMQYLKLGANQSNQQGQFNNQYWNNAQAYNTSQNQQNQDMWGSIGNLGQGGLTGNGGVNWLAAG